MQVYTFEEARKNALEFFNGDELAADVWVNKYALRDNDRNILEKDPKERFITIASELARVDKNYTEKDFREEYEASLINGEIIPGGSGLFGIGNSYSFVSLGNCFVISGNGEDSIGSIYKVDQESAQIYKRRGGVGLDLSHIRPMDFAVSNAAGTTTGPLSFADQYSETVRRIGQNGRRGALMESMHVNHPNVLDFILAKNDAKRLTGANVSVRITDEFMQAVENDGYYIQRYPVDLPTIPIMNLEPDQDYVDEDGNYWRKVRAREIFDELVRVNWESAEPGMLFWDKIINESPADCYPGFKTESTNPCGELPLSPYDSCRLLSMNLTQFVVNPFTSEARLDIARFITKARLAMRMMDNIIDLEIEKIESIIAKVEKDPEDEFTKAIEIRMWRAILENTKRGRRAGISLIGHGDFLAMLGIKYGSDTANEYIENIHAMFARWVYEESCDLATERGAFPAWETGDESQNPFLNRLLREFPHLVEKMMYGRRNIAILTIPPSGTLSIVLRQTSGIEPAFLLRYKRRRKVNPGENVKVDFVDDVGDSWEEYWVAHPKVEQWYRIKYPNESFDPQDLTEKILKESPWAGCTANEIDPLSKVRMQGMIQRWVDHSISVTHNLPENVSKETVADLYITSWKEGCKGCTIYRDGSRSGVLVSGDDDKPKNDTSVFEYRDAPKRPRELPCDIYIPTIHGEQYVVLVGLYQDKPYEVFAFKYAEVIPKTMTQGILKKQKSGTYHLLDTEGNIVVEDIRSRFELPDWDFATRMISTALRHGASIDFVVEQLNKAHGLIVTDYIKVIARQLKKYLKAPKEGTPCPECGDTLRVEGGCIQCNSCGYGKCG
jgi:ribonucleoside-diphosphate reductase alpha chain